MRDGFSMAYGARYLKRVIDDRVKIPLSQIWATADAFRVTARDSQIVVEAASPSVRRAAQLLKRQQG